MKRRVPTVVLSLVFLTSGYAAWDNVLSDNAPVRAEAEALACGRKACTEKHGMTKADRDPFGQTFEFTWRDAKVRVECRRPAWIVGARRCEAAELRH